MNTCSIRRDINQSLSLDIYDAIEDLPEMAIYHALNPTAAVTGENLSKKYDI